MIRCSVEIEKGILIIHAAGHALAGRGRGGEPERLVCAAFSFHLQTLLVSIVALCEGRFLNRLESSGLGEYRITGNWPPESPGRLALLVLIRSFQLGCELLKGGHPHLVDYRFAIEEFLVAANEGESVNNKLL